MFISRDTIFHEDIFPLKDTSFRQVSEYIVSQPSNITCDDSDYMFYSTNDAEPAQAENSKSAQAENSNHVQHDTVLKRSSRDRKQPTRMDSHLTPTPKINIVTIISQPIET